MKWTDSIRQTYIFFLNFFVPFFSISQPWHRYNHWVRRSQPTWSHFFPEPDACAYSSWQRTFSQDSTWSRRHCPSTGRKTVGNSAQYVRMAEPVFLCFAEDLLLLRLGICSNVQQVLWRILFKTACRQLRCFGLRGNIREEINIDGVADAPSGVLKIALHLMSRPSSVLAPYNPRSWLV